MLQTLTVDENPFQNAKARHAPRIAYKAFADVAGKASFFVITIVAARRLTAAAFGVFALGSTLGWMLAVAADWGIQMHLARVVARAPGRATALLAPWLRLRLWTAGGSLAVAAIVIASGRVDAGAALPIAMLALAYGCSGIVEFFYYFYRGLSRNDVEASVTLWHRIGTLIAALVALAWHPTVDALAVALLLPASIAAVACWRMAASAGNERPDDHVLQIRARSLRTEFRRDVFPIGTGIALSALYFRIDIFLVEAWSGTESVALYNAVFRLVEALRLFPAAVLAVTLPELCRATDARPVARVSLLVTGFAVVAASILWFSAPWTVPVVYGSRYAAAFPAFRILLMAFPLMSLNYALTTQLIAWDGHRTFAVLCGIALALNLTLNARLIPALSIDGAAWTTLATEVMLTIGSIGALARAMRSHPAAQSIALAGPAGGPAL
jgi:O-antigen/teichoic acid export membrane protein